MRIRAVIDIEVDFDLAGEDLTEAELNIPAIKDAVENCVMTDELTDLLVEELMDAAGFTVVSLSVNLERPIVMSGGTVL